MDAGSTVVLNSGGPDMTVMAVHDSIASVRYWPDEGTAQYADFPESVLTVKSGPILDMSDLVDDYVSRFPVPSRLVAGPEFLAQFKAHPRAIMFSPGKYFDANIVADSSAGLWYRFE